MWIVLPDEQKLSIPTSSFFWGGCGLKNVGTLSNNQVIMLMLPTNNSDAVTTQIHKFLPAGNIRGKKGTQVFFECLYKIMCHFMLISHTVAAAAVSGYCTYSYSLLC